MSNDRMLTPEAADDHVHRTLSLFMGRGRRFSVEEVSIGTGIADRTLSAMIAASPEARRRPSACHILMLASFFGVEFTERLLAPIGQGARDLDPAADAPGAIVATLITGAAEFARAGQDGAFCNRDRHELADDAASMIRILEPFTAPKAHS